MPAENEAPPRVQKNIKTQLSTDREKEGVREKPGDWLSDKDGKKERTDLNCCDKLKCLEINCALYISGTDSFPRHMLLFLCRSTRHMQRIQPIVFIHCGHTNVHDY